jgi:CubicO group peptidase (beta-lactamase class C family)
MNNRRVKPPLSILRAAIFIAWLCLASAGSAEFPLVELDGSHGFWANSSVPREASETLTQSAREPSADLRCFAFTGDGQWVFLPGGKDFHTGDPDLPVSRKLAELRKAGADFRCVAFAPGGGWTILHGAHEYATDGQVPLGAFRKIEEIGKRGGELRSIAYGFQGAWVLLFDKNGVAYGNVPKDLADVLDNAARDQNPVNCVAFQGDDWVCLCDKGWWTSNLDLPIARRIGQSIQQGGSPRWIAVSPNPGPHDFDQWAGIIHRAYDGKLAGGYGFEVRHHGKVVASGAEGWARAPWEKEAPSIPWTLDKPAPVASISKTITGVALLKLWEETNHGFSLDDPFWPYLGNLGATANAEVKRVTIRQLLTHLSGFDSNLDATDDLQKFLNSPLTHPPGATWEYEDNNYYILRLLIEEIGHVTYTAYVKTHVLEPMGITGMETRLEKDAPMCGYQKAGDHTPGLPFEWDQSKVAGAAGWWASVSDLGKFLNGLREHRVLSVATTQTMQLGCLGWDGSDPCFKKRGAWSGSEEAGSGEMNSVIAHFPDDVDAVLLVNCAAPVDLVELIEKAWEESAGGEP